MRCRTCRFVDSGGKENVYWYCCQCNDGPNPAWNPSCINCGHRDSSSGPEFSSLGYFESSRFNTEIETRHIRAKEVRMVEIPSLSLASTKLDDQMPLGETRAGHLEAKVAESQEERLDEKRVVDADTSFFSSSSTQKGRIIQSIPDASTNEESEQSSHCEQESDEEERDGTKTEPSESEMELGIGQIVRTYLRGRVRSLVRHIFLNGLHLAFDRNTGIIKCVSGEEQAERISGLSDQRRGVGSASNQRSNQDSKRHRDNQNRDEEDDSENDQNRNRPMKKAKMREDPEVPRLACLFFKRNPHQCKHDSCNGPGYTTMHHLK